jgi:hypothetical protein
MPAAPNGRTAHTNLHICTANIDARAPFHQHVHKIILRPSRHPPAEPEEATGVSKTITHVLKATLRDPYRWPSIPFIYRLAAPN